MVFLLFQMGGERYALDVRRVAEVLPLVNLRAIPQAPAAVAGLFDYHGSPVPAIDLSALTLGRPAHRQLSTRIILVSYPLGDGGERLLGLIAERATDTLRCEASDFVDPGIATEGAPHLGPVYRDALGFVQRVEVERLLPATVRDLLFRQAA